MVVIVYVLVQHFGFINGIGISAFAWMASMVILDDRLERREHRQYLAERSQQ